MFVGLLLLLLGALLLLDQLGIIRGGVWDYFWPAAIIAVGLSMIVEHSRRKNRHG
jgi:hypothetical protein